VYDALYSSVPTRADLEAEARAAQATADDSDDNLDLLETSLSEMSDMGFPDPLIGRPPIEEHELLADAAYDVAWHGVQRWWRRGCSTSARPTGKVHCVKWQCNKTITIRFK
jgi:hypothetical protein